ncbi:CPBP family intramembrane glutamic endopeptidase [Brevundimonas sp.]|uniref:CPBP family intramembrane glutamic endopeptidase n=1 Tax=Brevundimonas sp. TaxID=1871086 RepID=UPI00356235B6
MSPVSISSAASAPKAGGRRLAALQVVAMAVLVFAVSVPFSPSDVVGAGYGPKLALLGRMLLLVAAAAWMMRAAGRRWSDVGLRATRRWWVIPLAVVAGYLALGALAGAMQTVILPTLGLAAPDLSAFAALRGDLSEYLFWAVPVALGSAAIGEELVARGFLNDRIATLLGGAAPNGLVVFAAVILQGALFGACHAYQGLGGALLTGSAGIVIGLVWLWSGRNLWSAILLHGLVDFVGMTAFYSGVVGGAS